MKKWFNNFKQHVGVWLLGLWIVTKEDLKKFTDYSTSAIAAFIVIGLFYSFLHIMFAGNIWQSAASFIIGATIGILLISIIQFARTTDDHFYEVAIADLKSQLTDEEINYRLLQKSNESYARELQNKEILIKELAETLALTQKQYQDCYILLDQQRTEEFKKNNLSKVSVGKDGKLS